MPRLATKWSVRCFYATNLPKTRRRRGKPLRRVFVPGQNLGRLERDGKKPSDDRNCEHQKDYNNKLAPRHQFSHWSIASWVMRNGLSVH